MTKVCIIITICLRYFTNFNVDLGTGNWSAIKQCVIGSVPVDYDPYQQAVEYGFFHAANEQAPNIIMEIIESYVFAIIV